MQPLSYQLAEESCWVACMINGIRLVIDNDRIPTPVYRKLHCLLKDDSVPYCTSEERKAFKDTIEEVSNLTRLNIYHKREADVENALRGFRFSERNVAICDIGDGNHSILLHNRTGKWFDGFDPYWYGEERCGNQLLKFPKGNSTVNVRIHKKHLFAIKVDLGRYGKGEEYHMGKIKKRFLTVIHQKTPTAGVSRSLTDSVRT